MGFIECDDNRLGSEYAVSRFAQEITTDHIQENLARVVLQLRQAGVQAIAVCLLHSYRNPVHEERVRTVAQRVAPEVSISLSSEVVGEIREYERSVATILNAYVMPMVGTYLTEIETGLKANGINATLQIMQSNGGIISREFGERMPLRMLESGPAAGALGATYIARRSGLLHVVAFDMGGTTAKACLISNGEPEVTTEFETARVHRFKKGSGWPVRLPIVASGGVGAVADFVAGAQAGASGLLAASVFHYGQFRIADAKAALAAAGLPVRPLRQMAG